VLDAVSALLPARAAVSLGLDTSPLEEYAFDMRRCVSIVVAMWFVAVCAPYAHADSITDGTLYFTVTSGSLAPIASFVYDDTTSSFTSFTVEWDGAVFNFASLLTLAKLGTSGGWCAAGPSGIPPCGFPASFDLNGFIETFEADTFTNPGAAAGGGYSVIETTVPEPSSVALILLGLGGFAVVLKRLAAANNRRFRFAHRAQRLPVA
jgi:hypothetical protein